MPAKRNVMRHVSRGMYRRRRDPEATNSTTASERPARCKNGKNCFDLARSCVKISHVRMSLRRRQNQKILTPDKSATRCVGASFLSCTPFDVLEAFISAANNSSYLDDR